MVMVMVVVMVMVMVMSTSMKISKDLTLRFIDFSWGESSGGHFEGLWTLVYVEVYTTEARESFGVNLSVGRRQYDCEYKFRCEY